MHPEARAAARWWADLLRAEPKHENGEVDQSVMLTLLAKYTPQPNEEQVAVFEKALTSLIDNEIRELQLADDWPDENIPGSSGPPYQGVVFVENDYSPGYLLAEAIREARIDARRVPVKTQMHIKPGSVAASLSYLGEWRTVWSAESVSAETKGNDHE